MSTQFAIVNDRFVPLEQASIHINDLALQRGYGVFDFFRAVGRRFPFFDDHMDRLFHSASRFRLEIGKTRDELRSLLVELLERNGVRDAGIRITITGGDAPDGYTIGSPNIVVVQRPLPAIDDLAGRGIRLITHTHQRQFPDVKSLDYLMAIWLQPIVRQRGADDVLYVHDGAVSEAPRSSFFIVTRDQRIVTPGQNILKGVVRKQVLMLAARRFAVEEGTIRLCDLGDAKEAFVTSTTKGVMPVVQIDGRPIGAGRPGEITAWLGAQFQEHLRAWVTRDEP